MSGERLSLGAGGKVVEVNAFEGDLVKRGDVLLRLDTEKVDREIEKLDRSLLTDGDELERLRQLRRLLESQYAATRSREEAELAAAEQELERDREKQSAEIRIAEQELAKALEDERRTKELVDLDIEPRIRLAEFAGKRSEAEEKLRQARVPLDAHKVENRKTALEIVARDFAVRTEELDIRIAAKAGQIEAAKEARAVLEEEREKATLRAHVDGIVTVGDVKVGDLLEPGKAVIAIAQQKGFRVDAAVSTADVARIRVGMKARVKLDAFDYQKHGALTGTVYFVSPDSEVVEKRSFYVVRIRLDQPELPGGGRAKFGMTAQVEFLAGEERILSLVYRKVANKVDPR